MLSRTSKIIKRVAIFGDGTAKKTQKHYQDAFRVARILAQNNYIIVNGGGPGIMLAATMGAKSAAGRVELVILDPRHEPKHYEGADSKNTSLADKIYSSATYSRRLDKLIQLADAYIIFKGGTGTLSEIGLTWEQAKFDYGHHEPLIFYGRFWHKIVNDLIRGLELEKIEQRVVEVVDSPQAVLKVLRRIKR
jgi:uncharacterized protein (TIGR00725 family)